MAMPFHLSYAFFSTQVVTPVHLHFIISSAADRLGEFFHCSQMKRGRQRREQFAVAPSLPPPIEPAYIIEAEWLNNLRGEECRLICFSAVRHLRFWEKSELRPPPLSTHRPLCNPAIKWQRTSSLTEPESNSRLLHINQPGVLIEAKWLLWAFKECVGQIKTSVS